MIFWLCRICIGLLMGSPLMAQMITEKPESAGGNPEGVWEAVRTPLKVYVPPELLAIVSNLTFEGTTSGQLKLEASGAYQADLIFQVKASGAIGFFPFAFDVADTNRTQGAYAVENARLIFLPANALPDTAAFTVRADSMYLVQPLALGGAEALVRGLAPTAGPPLAVLGLKRVGPPPFTGPITADFNGDGVVDFADFLAFVSRFGARAGDAHYESIYDLDGNGEIGFSDFLSFAAQFGRRG